jgi:hypothetical protein
MKTCWQRAKYRKCVNKKDLPDDCITFTGAFSETKGLIYFQLKRQSVDRWAFMDFLKKLIISTGSNIAIVLDNAG